jgi:hypothetical protein
VNGSALESVYNSVETLLGSTQTLIQVQLTDELVLLETNALRSVNSIVFPSGVDGSLNFTGTCNMTIVSSQLTRTITFQTCSATPNAYNCSLQVTETQQDLSGINQTLNQINQNITNINSELNQLQLEILNRSSIVSLNLNNNVKVYGPDVTWTNGTNIIVTATNASGIFLQRTGSSVNGFNNTFGQSTTSRHLNFGSSAYGTTVTSNNVNTLTVGVTSARDNVCVQIPNPTYVSVNAFTGFTSALILNTFLPANVAGGLGISCGPATFFTWFNTNCPGFPSSFFFPSSECTNFQGWLQQDFILDPATNWFKFRVPTTGGKIWTVQLDIFASITGDASINNANAITAGLVAPTSTPTSGNCNGPLVASFASTMNIVTAGSQSYYYYGEITFSTDDPEWVPGRLMFLCVYFTGPGVTLIPPSMMILPSLIRLA